MTKETDIRRARHCLFPMHVLPDIALGYYYKGVLWTPSYFASSCGGASISIIRQYIEQQQTPG
nr:transposase [Serratia quinivorans]